MDRRRRRRAPRVGEEKSRLTRRPGARVVVPDVIGRERAVKILEILEESNARERGGEPRGGGRRRPGGRMERSRPLPRARHDRLRDGVSNPGDRPPPDALQRRLEAVTAEATRLRERATAASRSRGSACSSESPIAKKEIVAPRRQSRRLERGVREVSTCTMPSGQLRERSAPTPSARGRRLGDALEAKSRESRPVNLLDGGGPSGRRERGGPVSSCRWPRRTPRDSS